jgi:hypothetical protein
MRKSMPAPVSRKQLLPALNLLALGGGGARRRRQRAGDSPGGDDSARLVMSPKGSIGIPKLQLGVIQVAPSGDKGAVVAASHGTRSSRRMSHRGAFSPALPALLAAAGAQSRTAAQEMKSLAFKLGETYCTQDLTVLLQYKKRVLGSPVFTKHKEEENVVDAEEQIMRGTAYYRCKVDLLRVLDFIASDRRELSSIPSPINLLFQELATTYEHGVSIDDAKNALVFSVLGHLAQYNEHCAINAVPPPPAVTAGMPKEFVDVLSDDAKRAAGGGAAPPPRLARVGVDAARRRLLAARRAVPAARVARGRGDGGRQRRRRRRRRRRRATRTTTRTRRPRSPPPLRRGASGGDAASATPLQASTRGGVAPNSNNEHNVTEFLLMINNRLKVYLSTLLVDDLNVPLSVLADYMNKCRTRVLASRVVTVCLSSLLRVKQTIFSEALKVDSFRLVRTVHYLLMVFDEIAMQNSSSTLNTLLLSVLFEGTKNATFLQEYATQLLINEQFASKTLARRNGAWLLSQYRQRVIEHFRTLVAMVEREQELVLASVDSVGLGVTTTHGARQAARQSPHRAARQAARAARAAARRHRGAVHAAVPAAPLLRRARAPCCTSRRPVCGALLAVRVRADDHRRLRAAPLPRVCQALHHRRPRLALAHAGAPAPARAALVRQAQDGRVRAEVLPAARDGLSRARGGVRVHHHHVVRARPRPRRQRRGGARRHRVPQAGAGGGGVARRRHAVADTRRRSAQRARGRLGQEDDAAQEGHRRRHRRGGGAARRQQQDRHADGRERRSEHGRRERQSGRRRRRGRPAAVAKVARAPPRPQDAAQAARSRRRRRPSAAHDAAGRRPRRRAAAAAVVAATAAAAAPASAVGGGAAGGHCAAAAARRRRATPT